MLLGGMAGRLASQGKGNDGRDTDAERDRQRVSFTNGQAVEGAKGHKEANEVNRALSDEGLFLSGVESNS